MSESPRFEDPSPLSSATVPHLLWIDYLVDDLNDGTITAEEFVSLYYATRGQVLPPKLDLASEAAH